MERSPELTSPADAQAETALRENSNTIREQTLEPTTERRIARDQNWKVVLQPDFRSEDDSSGLSLSVGEGSDWY